MGKTKKKAAYSRREEQQAKRVLCIMGVVAVVLAVLMCVLFS